jgi:predicted DNA-binding transcriptional regulator AlpA
MKKHDEFDELKTVSGDEFRRLLDVSPNTFAKLLKNGDIPSPLPLNCRVKRWSRSEVLEFLRA